jgi:hypothetical protein
VEEDGYKKCRKPIEPTPDNAKSSYQKATRDEEIKEE